MTIDSLSRPNLVIITGVPGTGKSTLARTLSLRLAWRVFHHDDIKERLYDASGIAIADLNQETSRHFGAMAEAAVLAAAGETLRAGFPCIIESFFRPESPPPALALLVRESSATQVHCVTPAAVSIARYRARHERGERHPVHLDQIEASERASDPLPDSALTPVPLGIPVLTVDTQSGYTPGLHDIVAFCTGGDSRRPSCGIFATSELASGR